VQQQQKQREGKPLDTAWSPLSQKHHYVVETQLMLNSLYQTGLASQEASQ
jgi:hypothetical protein